MAKNKTIKTIAGATLGVVSLGAGMAMAATGSDTTTNTKSPSSWQHKGINSQAYQNLTDAQKTALTQARTLMQQGKQDEAKAILDAAGVKSPKGEGKGKMNKQGMHGDMKKVDEAIVNGDYTSFKTVASGTPLANISQDVFNSLRAPMQAKQAAEKVERSSQDQIQTILKNAGVQMPERGDRNTSGNLVTNQSQ